jgi:hypothetical protein
MRAAHIGAAYSPADPEFAGLVLPVRRTRHPVAGSVDIKVDFSVTIQLVDGGPVIETLYEIKLKVAETLTAFKAEFK